MMSAFSEAKYKYKNPKKFTLVMTTLIKFEFEPKNIFQKVNDVIKSFENLVMG